MSYVDGFVIPLPKNKVDEYKAMSKGLSGIWKELGATDYVECLGDDVPYGEVTSFPRAVQATDDEVVIFSWIVYPSKEVRDACNAKVMTDPRMADAMKNPIFDGKRMIYGGFDMILRV